MYSNYIVDPTAEIPVMLIDKHIGFDSELGPGVMGDEFVRDLMYLDSLGKESIECRICSEGGSVMDGMKIYNAMLKTATPVDTYNGGVAASISAVLFTAGRKKTMADYAQLMFHNPSGGEDDALQPIKESLVKMIANRCGKSEEDISNIMNRTTWIDAEEAKGIFCDDVEDSGLLNKFKNMLVGKKLSFARDIINNAYSKNSDTMDKELLKAVGLPETATKAEYLAKLDEIKNRATTAEGNLKKIKNAAGVKDEGDDEGDGDEEGMSDSAKAKMKALKAKNKEMENTINTMKSTMDSVKETVNSLKSGQEANETATKAAAAATMVNKYVNRIGNNADVVKNWVEKATTDLEGTEKLLSGLPLKATKVEEMKNVIYPVKGEYKENEVPIDNENPNAYFATMNGKKAIEVKNRVKI